jgi:hypothetical protein
MEKKLSIYSTVLGGEVELIALVKGRPMPKLVTISAKPEDWHGGHPLGAVLMKPVDVDCRRMTKPFAIDGWRVIHDGAVIGDEMLPSPLRLEPKVAMRLERCVVVRRFAMPDSN